MGFLATLAFLGFGWVTFDGAIMKREDPNHALTVAAGVDEWVLRRNRNGHYFSPGLINGQPVKSQRNQAVNWQIPESPPTG